MTQVNVLIGRGAGFKETIYLKAISKPGYVGDNVPWAGQYVWRPFTVTVCGAEIITVVTEKVTSSYLFHATSEPIVCAGNPHRCDY